MADQSWVNRLCIHLISLAILAVVVICGGFEPRHIANERDDLEHPATHYSTELYAIEQLAEDLQWHLAHQAGETQVMLKDDELIKGIDANRHKRHNKHATPHTSDRTQVVNGATSQ